jgi:catechol 2,3-dioxygenase-like lactoylglutathione lyase family enzyme
MSRQRPLTHVGITVPDLEAAVTWYAEVLGYRPLIPVGEIRSGDGYLGLVGDDLWKDDFTAVKVAHLGSGEDGVIELLEFATPPAESSMEYEYWRAGWSHICVVDPDIDALIAAIVAGGGRQISQVWQLFEDRPFKMVYTLDPWGNMIEVYTHPHTEAFSEDF